MSDLVVSKLLLVYLARPALRTMTSLLPVLITVRKATLYLSTLLTGMDTSDPRQLSASRC